MKTKITSPITLSLLLCVVMMLSMIPGGIAVYAFAPGCTHVHTEKCLSCEKAEHSHTDECSEGQLLCEQEEHSHTEDCYQNCQHVCGEECGVAEDAKEAEKVEEAAEAAKAAEATETTDEAPGIMLTGTLGDAALKLDGDWAYLTKFEILDDLSTTDVVEGIQDGAGPFDTDTDPSSMSYKDRQGNDENDQNGKVRSFDTVTYKLNYATATSGEYDYVGAGWMNYELVLPYDSTRAVWQTNSMAWVGTMVVDQAGLDAIEEQTSGYYLTTETRQGVSCQVLHGKYWLAPNETNPYAIPGEGTLSAVVQVLAMEEGDILEPQFSGWMEHNVTDQTTCSNHQRAEIKTFVAPPTEVTAEVRLDIQVKGIAASDIGSVNFDSGDTDAPNRGEGTLTGKVEAYSIGVYLWNGTSDGKGRKGLMAPQSGDTMTFDLTMDAIIDPSDGSDNINIANTDYAPLLWALGSNDDAMDWRGRTTLTAYDYEPELAANTAFDVYTRGNNACYDGGNWSFTIAPSDPNKISVTINSMEIDLSNFPEWNMAETYSYNTSGAIPITSGQLQLLQPVVKADGTHIMEDTSFTGSAIYQGEVCTSLRDDNMSYTYVSKTDNQNHTLINNDQTNKSNDTMSLEFYTEKGGGVYDSYAQWSDKPNFNGSNSAIEWPNDTVGGKYYWKIGGDPAVRNQTIGAFFGSVHRSDLNGDSSVTVAAKCLLKFDDEAVTPNGEIGYYYVYSAADAFERKPLYATKSDGTGWDSDDEMESTTMTQLTYYESMEDIPSGSKCVGVLVEYLPTDTETYQGIDGTWQHLYADVGFNVNENAQEGNLYQCTIEHYIWNKADYEAAGKNIPSLLNNTSTTLPLSSEHVQPEYNKGAINPLNGHLEGDTGGYSRGDVMQIICARSVITKEVAQIENGTNKYVYYMDSDQRFVDYKLNVSTEYVTHNVVSLPEGVRATLTIIDAMPSGIKYEPDSAYYGGTYTQNIVPGRQGTITGGTPLVLQDSWESDGLTWYKFEIPDVAVGEPLQPVYLTARIGTRGIEATDVTDGQIIKNKALSQVGQEITTTEDDLGFNQGAAEIKISKNNALSRSKLADKTYIEKGDSFNWTINVGNNGGNTMPDTVALDVFPYNEDGQGTSFSGTLSLTEWKVDVTAISNFNDANWKIMYTTNANVRGTQSSEYDAAAIINGMPSGPNNVVFNDITTLTGASVNWTNGVVTLPSGFNPAAMVMVGSLPGGETLKMQVQMSLANGQQGNILVNQLDGYPVPVYTVRRSIEGCTWIDANRDGVRQDPETMLAGVTATLYKLEDGGVSTDEADYEAVYDENNAVVSVETNRQKDAVTGVQTDYLDGRYQFTNLPAGTYAVKFTSGATDLSAYIGSPVNIGLDDTRDSDATPAYNETSGLLEKTVILGIVMDAANDSMKDINQVSRDNDSGFYSASQSLSISKTVTGNMGDREKLFDFKIMLKDAAGNNISDTYTCVGGEIENSGAAAPTITQLIFTNGIATLQLKHGQIVTIQDLPNHCQYTVEEPAVAGYTTTVAGDENNTDMQTDETVAYTNNASLLTPTGILLDFWYYVLVVLLALGGVMTCFVAHKKRKSAAAPPAK